jgi:hypothetical protein
MFEYILWLQISMNNVIFMHLLNKIKNTAKARMSCFSILFASGSGIFPLF